MKLTVGPLCRYFAADEAQARQRLGGVEAWRQELLRGLAERGGGIEDWVEDPELELQAFEISGRALRGLRLLAVYAQRPELEWPDLVPEELSSDPAWLDAQAEDFQKSHYGQLLAAECWLPGRFDFSFRCPRPDGEAASFGSLLALVDQLGFLNARSLQVDLDLLAAAPPADSPKFVQAAVGGMLACLSASLLARDRGLPLWLDDGAL